MKRQKIIMLVLSAALAAAAVSGCDNGRKTDSGETEVEVWTGNTHDKAFMTEQVNNWNKKNGKKSGIRINYFVPEGNINEKLEAAFSSGNPPAIYTASIQEDAQNGRIVAYDDIKGTEKMLSRFKSFISASFMYKGKVYGVPTCMTTYGIVYNTQMFKNAGIVDENGNPTPPRTLEELRSYAKRLTNEQKQEYGIIFPAKFRWWYDDDIIKLSSPSSECGYPAYNPRTGFYDYTAVIKVMKTLLGIKADGSYFPGAEGIDNDPARACFGKGGIGMKTCGSYDYSVYTKQFPAQIDWEVAPYPVADLGDRHLQHMLQALTFSVSKAAQKRIGDSKIVSVLEFFNSDGLMVEKYKNGSDLPVDLKLIKNISIDKGMKQWRQFADLMQISTVTPPVVSETRGDDKGLPVLWKEEIWNGNVSENELEGFVRKYQDDNNARIIKYAEEHPEYDRSAYIVPDWNNTR